MAKKLDIVAECGCLLRSLREERGHSQEELAELSDLDRTYISGVERGRRNITLATLHRIINALDIPVSRFLDLLSKQLKDD